MKAHNIFGILFFLDLRNKCNFQVYDCLLKEFNIIKKERNNRNFYKPTEKKFTLTI